MVACLVGAIPNLAAAAVLISSLRVVLTVLASPEPAEGVSPASAVLLLEVAAAPSRPG